MKLPQTRIKNTHRRNCERRGAEVVELALILPLLLLIVFSTLEICEQAFLLQKVKIAAHEGAVTAISKTATLSDVEQAVQEYLDARGVVFGNNISSAVVVSPDPTTADALTPISVTVTVPNNENSQVGANFYRYIAGDNSTGRVTMFKEFSNNE